MSDLHQVTDGVITSLTKFLVAISGGNLLVAVAALLDLVPAIASVISLFFLVWVGVLTIRERKLSIRIKSETLDDMERQRQVELGR